MANVKLTLYNKQLKTVEAIKDAKAKGFKTIIIGENNYELSENLNKLRLSDTYYNDTTDTSNISFYPKDFYNENISEPMPKIASEALNNLNFRLSKVDNWETRISSVEQKMSELTGQVTNLKTIVERFNERISNLEDLQIERLDFDVQIYSTGDTITDIYISGYIERVRDNLGILFFKSPNRIMYTVSYNSDNKTIYISSSKTHVGLNLPSTAPNILIDDMFYSTIDENNKINNVYNASGVNLYFQGADLRGTIPQPKLTIEISEIIYIPLPETIVRGQING